MIIGTAGHIDHGKTALVRALTGVDTDRLPEEKRRGITIVLGFAPLELGALGPVGIVDVPGHEGFVRTMLAGASGMDCALLVIAADAGVMPQTREHLRILELLGVTRAVVALTKIDLVDDEMREVVALDVHELLAGSALASAPIVAVSAKTGLGLDALRNALANALGAVHARETADLFRMPVDRVFSIAGAGTVVTGTTWSGRLRVGDRVRILPGSVTARVRGLERHGVAVQSAAPGARLAVALVGVEREVISVGAVLVGDAEPWSETRRARADVALSAGAPAVGVRTKLRFHVGTAETGVRLVARGGPLVPGGPRAVRLALDAPMVLRAGDRFVLRGGSPHTTIGGGVISDPAPGITRVRPWPEVGADAATRLGWILEEAGAAGVEVGTLPIRLGIRPSETERLLKGLPRAALIGERLVATAALEELRAALLSAVRAAHDAAPLAPGLDRETARGGLRASVPVTDEVIRRAERAGILEVSGSVLRLPGWRAGAAPEATDRSQQLLAALEAAGAEPPSVSELAVTFGKDVVPLLKLLEGRGAATQVVSDRWFATSAVRELLARLRAQVVPDRRYTPSELREILQVSRKYLIPFLEWTDRRRISHRADDGRSFREIPTEP